MKRYFFWTVLFSVLSLASCKNDLFPFEANEPLIVSSSSLQAFDAKTLTNPCEIQYIEENLFGYAYNNNTNLFANSYVYKAFQEWNNAKTNVKFAFQKERAKCNLIVIKDNYDRSIANVTDENSLGLVKINGDIIPSKNIWNPNLYMESANSVQIILPLKNLTDTDGGRYKRHILMYLIGKYLGLPDSKDRASCMYPYLVKEGPVVKITDEDIRILNILKPYSPCGSVEAEVKSVSPNADGTANLSVNYTNSNPKEKVYGCGVVLSEDSTMLNVARGSFYYFQSNFLGSTFSGKITKLNAQTKYYVKAFSLDANGITYGKKITPFNIPNRLHDKWVTIELDKEITSISDYNSYFEYGGKLYLGVTKNSSFEMVLNQCDINTGHITPIVINNFPNSNDINRLFYLNGYLYVLNESFLSTNLDSRFNRLSVKTLTWEKLKSPSENDRYYSTYIFSNENYLYLVKRNIDTPEIVKFQRYDTQNSIWVTLDEYANTPNPPYDQFRYNYYQYVAPSFYNNQLYFSTTNGSSIYFDIFINKWKYFAMSMFVEQQSIINDPEFSKFAYTSTFTVPFQNKMLKYYSNHNGLYGYDISNNTNAPYQYTTQENPKVFDAFKSNLNNFDRQLLVTIDLNNKSLKELCNPPDKLKVSSLDRSNYSTYPFVITTNDNFYIGILIGNTNTVKSIAKYIP